MFRKSIAALSICAFTVTNIAPTMAADFSGMPDMRYNPYGVHAQTRGTTAGAYIRIPFKGGLKRPREEARLGLALSTSLPGQYHDPGRFAAMGTPRLIDLSLGLSSLGHGRQPLGQSLQFNGMSINQINALYADEDGKKKGSAAGTVLKTALIVVGGFFVVGAVVYAVQSEPERDPTYCGWFTLCE